MVIKSLEPIGKEKKEKGFTTRNDFFRLESVALFIDRSAIKPCVMMDCLVPFNIVACMF